MPARWSRQSPPVDQPAAAAWDDVAHVVHDQFRLSASTKVAVLEQITSARFIVSIGGERFDCVLRRNRTRLDVFPSRQKSRRRARRPLTRRNDPLVAG